MGPIPGIFTRASSALLLLPPPRSQKEIESWSDLNVIEYYGNAQARQLIHEHEGWFEGDNRRTCASNVILTTYEMIKVPSSLSEPSLGNIHWRCLICDGEGIRTHAATTLPTGSTPRQLCLAYRWLTT